jgi:hypothetical protein
MLLVIGSQFSVHRVQTKNTEDRRQKTARGIMEGWKVGTQEHRRKPEAITKARKDESTKEEGVM